VGKIPTHINFSPFSKHGFEACFHPFPMTEERNITLPKRHGGGQDGSYRSWKILGRTRVNDDTNHRDIQKSQGLSLSLSP
jgi:hypothetical protein